MKHISIFLLCFFLFNSENLVAQCEGQGQGQRFQRLIEQGNYVAWDIRWQKRKRLLVNNKNLKYNFQCQSQRALEQLIRDFETSFKAKKRITLSRAVSKYNFVMTTIASVYPRFHSSFAAKDYHQYGKYADYLILVERYSSNSANDNFELNQQLGSALDNLIAKADLAIVNSNLGLGKEVAESYVYLLDKLGEVDDLLRDDMDGSLPSFYADKYNDMECLPEYIASAIAFANRQYIQALEYTACEAPSTQRLSLELQQRLVDNYIGRTSESVNLLIQASAIAEIDSIAKGLSRIGIDTLPCPTSLSVSRPRCDFYSIINERREEVTSGLDKRAIDLYSKEYFKEAFTALEAVISISLPRSTLYHTLGQKRSDWLEQATGKLDAKRKSFISDKNWGKARNTIKEIVAFNPAYNAEEMENTVSLHEFYNKAKSATNNRDWLEALKWIEESYKKRREITCSPCAEISLSEIEVFRSGVIEQLEDEIDHLNEKKLNLDAARNKVDEIVKVHPDYPSQIKKARLECIYYIKRGDRFYSLKDYDSALDVYKIALTSCQRANSCSECMTQEQILEKIRSTIDKLIVVTLEKAKAPYSNNDYVSACELVLQAQKWVVIHREYQISQNHIYKYREKYEYLVHTACSKARKTVKVILKQTSMKKFSEETCAELKQYLDEQLANQLDDLTYGKYIDVVVSGSADFVLEVDISNLIYNTNYDDNPSIDYYCTYTRRYVTPNCYVLDYRATKEVKKYHDSATGKVGYRSNINRYSSYSDQITKKWNQEAWRSDTECEYLAYCRTNLGSPVVYLNSKECSYFQKIRRGPGMQKLLLPALRTSFYQTSFEWAEQISRIMRG